MDDVVRKLNRLCWIVRDYGATGKLIRLASQLRGDGIGRLEENLYLNQVPHNRHVRHYFYDMASRAILKAILLCANGKMSNRMKTVVMFPELNPTMDSYR